MAFTIGIIIIVSAVTLIVMCCIIGGSARRGYPHTPVIGKQKTVPAE